MGSAWPDWLLGNCGHEPLLGWLLPALETDIQREGMVTKSQVMSGQEDLSEKALFQQGPDGETKPWRTTEYWA